VLPKAKRELIGSMARAWWAEYGHQHEAIGRLALAQWKPGARLSILEDVEHRYPGVA
jgi:hypothetical protein